MSVDYQYTLGLGGPLDTQGSDRLLDIVHRQGWQLANEATGATTLYDGDQVERISVPLAELPGVLASVKTSAVTLVRQLKGKPFQLDLWLTRRNGRPELGLRIPTRRLVTRKDPSDSGELQDLYDFQPYDALVEALASELPAMRLDSGLDADVAGA